MHIRSTHTHIKKRGTMLLGVVVFSSIAITLVAGFVGWTQTTMKLVRNSYYKEQAFQIAEAGIDYYRWHLAHNKNDFQDGTGQAGPYTHDFEDKNGNVIGQFILTITPPPTGSTVVTISSRGVVTDAPTISRTIQAKLAIPSFAKWAVVANDTMRFGEGTETFGPIHSNGGIRFDGLAHNVVSSTVSSYDDPDHDESGSERLEYGVHTHVKPPPQSGSYVQYVSAEMPPATPSARSDVFMAGRQFPVSPADFTGITANLSQIKTSAQSGGRYFASSGYQGYRILLKTNDTFDLYRVTNLSTITNGCSQNSSGEDGWGTWSIRSNNGQTLLGNYTFPSNGLIFVEDNLWVEGTINTARLTIAAGRFPDNAGLRKSITINNDLKYTNYDGRDVLALIAQKNINVGFVSEDDLQIDSALIAQNGRVGRYFYSSSCSTYYDRSVLRLYGMIATNQRYGFAYANSGGQHTSGYIDRILTYDANLLYAPPPSFPLTSDSYSTISWEEIE